MQRKVGYLLKSLALYLAPSSSHCPNCGGRRGVLMDRKYLITRLIRCNECKLMYRVPTDSEKYNKFLYNYLYTEGITTDIPNSADLADMVANNFTGLNNDYSGYIAFLRRQGIDPGDRIFDFGCSWGYGSFQMEKAGYDVYSFEIGIERRKYGVKNLSIKHIDEPFDIKQGHPMYESFDCFFSAHVLEHVPSPSKIIDLAWKCLKPGGAFVAFTPNGNMAYRKYNEPSWRKMWGSVHPNFLDEVFYDKQFSRSKRVYAARDGSDVNSQYELGFFARKSEDQEGF